MNRTPQEIRDNAELQKQKYILVKYRINSLKFIQFSYQKMLGLGIKYFNLYLKEKALHHSYKLKFRACLKQNRKFKKRIKELENTL